MKGIGAAQAVRRQVTAWQEHYPLITTKKKERNKERINNKERKKGKETNKERKKKKGRENGFWWKEGIMKEEK